MKKRQEIKGLIKLRAVTGKEPAYDCSNCKCKRYSKCGCKKKEAKWEKQQWLYILSMEPLHV